MVEDVIGSDSVMPIPATTSRVVIEHVTPCVDAGRFPVKRVVGDRVEVQADVFADGHDVVAALVRYRRVGEKTWQRTPMTALINDRWSASFTVEEMGRYSFTVEGWVDHFAGWVRAIVKKLDAEVATETDLETGTVLIEAGASRATGAASLHLSETAQAMRDPTLDLAERVARSVDENVVAAMRAFPDRSNSTVFDRTY
jgi:starch synthase (maltosyl-transferring)